MSTKKKIVVFLSIFMVFVTAVWVISVNQKDKAQLVKSIHDELERLEIKFSKNTSWYNDDEIELTKIKRKAHRLKDKAPRKFHKRIQTLIDKCDEQL